MNREMVKDAKVAKEGQAEEKRKYKWQTDMKKTLSVIKMQLTVM